MSREEAIAVVKKLVDGLYTSQVVSPADYDKIKQAVDILVVDGQIAVPQAKVDQP